MTKKESKIKSSHFEDRFPEFIKKYPVVLFVIYTQKLASHLPFDISPFFNRMLKFIMGKTRISELNKNIF